MVGAVPPALPEPVRVLPDGWDSGHPSKRRRDEQRNEIGLGADPRNPESISTLASKIVLPLEAVLAVGIDDDAGELVAEAVPHSLSSIGNGARPLLNVVKVASNGPGQNVNDVSSPPLSPPSKSLNVEAPDDLGSPGRIALRQLHPIPVLGDAEADLPHHEHEIDLRLKRERRLNPANNHIQG